MFIRALCVLGIKARDGRSPIYPGSVVEVDDEVGLRMINNCSAKEMPCPDEKTARPASPKPGTGENPPKAVNAPEGPKTGVAVDEEASTMDRAYLETLTFTELKEIAKTFGVYSGTMRSKEAVIEALTSIPVGEELPVLTPQDVVDA